jgi:hypothetical protein
VKRVLGERLEVPVLVGGMEPGAPCARRAETDVDAPRKSPVPVRVAVDALVRRSVVAGVSIAVAVADARPQLEWPDPDVDHLVREANHALSALPYLEEDLGRAPRDEVGKEIARGTRTPSRARKQEGGRQKQRGKPGEQRRKPSCRQFADDAVEEDAKGGPGTKSASAP